MKQETATMWARTAYCRLMIAAVLFWTKSRGMLTGEYIAPTVMVSPQKAFYFKKESLPIQETAGRISGEFVMCYPPGIPILAPGEMITKEIVEYIFYARDKGCSMQGMEDTAVEWRRNWFATLGRSL